MQPEDISSDFTNKYNSDGSLCALDFIVDVNVNIELYPESPHIYRVLRLKQAI